MFTLTNSTALPMVAFDADDTLWPNENYFREGEQEIIQLLNPYYQADDLLDRLYENEVKNLQIFGYGAKGFALSMIESLIELSNGQVSGSDIQKVIDIGKSIMSYPITLLPGVRDCLEVLKEADYQLMIITKGDLFDQESKIARSGLAELFEHIEITTDKSEQTYLRILKKYHIEPKDFWMVGNSLKSDILPVARLGGHAVYVPYTSTWAHEHVPEDHAAKHDYFELTAIAELPMLLKREIHKTSTNLPVQKI